MPSQIKLLTMCELYTSMVQSTALINQLRISGCGGGLYGFFKHPLYTRKTRPSTRSTSPPETSVIEDEEQGGEPGQRRKIREVAGLEAFSEPC